MLIDKGTVERHNLLVEDLLISQQFSDVHKDIVSREPTLKTC